MNRRWFGNIVLLGLAVFAAAAGAAPGAANSPTQRQLRGAEQYQKWLEKEVRHELVMLPYYSVFDNLEYRVEGTRVVLSGQVVRPTLRSDAGAAVKGIEGVEQVENKIEVLPVSPLDDRLRVALYRAIYSDSTLFRYSVQAVPPIHIIVKNGHVVLEGVVANESEKNLAGLRANSVADVFSVTNHLRTEK